MWSARKWPGVRGSPREENAPAGLTNVAGRSLSLIDLGSARSSPRLKPAKSLILLRSLGKCINSVRLAGTPIIAVSSFAMKSDEEKARSAGCDHYVTKPYSPIQLLRTVRTFTWRAKLKKRRPDPHRRHVA